MAWKVRDCMSQRRDFVTLASAEGANMAQLCHRFGIARKTGYKWLHRYHTNGQAGLMDQSRRPHHLRCPTPEPIVQQNFSDSVWHASAILVAWPNAPCLGRGGVKLIGDLIPEGLY